MEDTAIPPSTTSSLSSNQTGLHPTWISNMHHLPQISPTQVATSGGKGLTGSNVSIRGNEDTGKTSISLPPDELGLAVSCQKNGALKLDGLPNAMPPCNICQENVGSNLSTSSNSLQHSGLLQACGTNPSNPATFSENLHKIENLALNSSLSLDAPCYSLEGKMASGIDHNPVANSLINNPNDSSSPIPSSFLPRRGSKLQPPNASSGELYRSKIPNMGSSYVQNDNSSGGISSASCCECHEALGVHAPGTELSLAIASVVDNGVEHKEDAQSFLSSWRNSPQAASASSSMESSLSRKDEIFIRLGELEAQLHERKEWAHKKALQAACKFSKDMAELKSLRLEHEEILCLKRDTQALEDNTMKRLTEMESALRKAGAQVDRANASVRKLETGNAELRAEMEAAKLSAAESNAKCQEVAKREKKSSKKIQAWEKQKAKMLDEIAKKKQQIAQAQEQLSSINAQQQEAEMRWREEEKAKDDALALADAEKWAREQLDAVSKRKEEMWHRKADADYQRHKDDIERLESELRQLRMAAETHNSDLSSGIISHSASDTHGLQALKETSLQLLQELAELQDSREICRDRECVMCMSEESSVVFLPCAHQIVCTNCNDLHQKQGMRDCPSCRTVIQRRIHVLIASIA